MHPPIMEANCKPSRSKVEIEELLDCDLMSGVRIAPLEIVKVKEERPPSWPQVFYSIIADNHWIDDEVGSFHLNVESYIKKDSGKPEEVWFPFTCQDVESVELVEANFIAGSKKYEKVVQRFHVKLCPPEEGKAHVPYIQFYCGMKYVRHTGAVFKEHDLLTIVVCHPKYPLHWPKPPIITVVPVAEQTFVPMMPKQKMVIVTNQAEQIMDFKGHANSTIKHAGSLPVDFGMECHYFHCTKPSHSSEIIFINQKKKPKTNKKVVVPFCEKEVRYPVILNPLKNAVIHAQNIDGFYLRFWKDNYHPALVLSGTPVRGVFTNENAQYIERRFEIDKRRPFFYLEKKDHSWVIH